MAGIPSEFIEELKHRSNIVSVVSRYLPLEQKGRNHWGRCPFHLEKTPSFSVNEVDQYFHCFGCKASGNVIKFVMEMESVSFVEAIHILAGWAGMEVPVDEVSREQAIKAKKEREEMIECMKECAKHYHENLLKSNIALDYLKNRGIDKDMITRFGIGYANGYTEIIDYLENKGYKKDLLYRLGIIKEKDGRFYDSIGDRIAFPIINIYGEVVAFSGRTMKKQVDYAKYINTGDTPIFSKSKNLFAINLVKKAKQTGRLSTVIIVEGQTDVIALHKAGYGGAVASLGTALTVDQARIIKRLTDNVIICYDGDTAGTKATLRGLDILKHENLNVRVASMPNGMDPDELLRTEGNKAVDRVLESAIPLVEYKLVKVREKHNLKEFDGKAKYVDEAIDVLLGLEEVEAEVYLDMISSASGVYKDFLRNKLKDRTLKLTANNTVASSAVKREAVRDTAHTKTEICVIANILRKTTGKHDPEKIVDLFDGELKFVAESARITNFAEEFIAKLAEEQYLEIVGAVVNYDFSEDKELNQRVYEDCLWNLYKAKLLSRQEELMNRVSTETGEDREKIMAELRDIIKKINSREVEL